VRFEKTMTRARFLSDQVSANQSIFASVLEGYLQAGPSKKLSVKAPLRYRLAGGGLLPVATIDVNRETLHSLAKQPGVIAVLPNQPVHLLKPTSVSESKLSPPEVKKRCTWGLDRLGIRELWLKSKTQGAGTKVAVLDTGVFGNHCTLAGKVKGFVIIDPAGRRLRLAENETFDYDRHGTHVCGTIAGGETAEGVAIGVAPEAELHVAQIHFGNRAFLSSIMDGIVWSLQAGADVINMSIGVSYYDEKIDELFQLLVDRGVAPVVAIGNDSHGTTKCPGNSSFALGIGAVAKSNGGVDVASFSSGGSLDFPGQEPLRIVKPDVVAPGAEIFSCVPPSSADGNQEEYRLMDGTSMAAPHVSGILAILMAANREIEVAELFRIVRETADHPKGGARPDNRWGAWADSTARCPGRCVFPTEQAIVVNGVTTWRRSTSVFGKPCKICRFMSRHGRSFCSHRPQLNAGMDVQTPKNASRR